MLKISQVKVKITPQGRFFPALMPNRYWAEDISDDQFASVLVLEVDQNQALWVCLDAIGVSKEIATALRERLSKQFNIPMSHINIGYSHSHCAVMMGSLFGRPVDENYVNYVMDQVADATEQAFKKGLCEVNAYTRSYDGYGYYSNRNGLDKKGDTEIRVVEFRNDKNEVKGLILALACHSTVVNFQNTRSLTSDLVGYLCRGLEKRTGVYPLTMVGAAGDMSNRCCRQGNDYAELERVGNGLLSRMDIRKEEIKLSLDKLDIESYQFQETYITTKDQRQKQIEDIKNEIKNAKTDDLRRVFNSALDHAMMEPNGCEFNMDLEGSYINMGDMKILTMPAELFSKFGLEIKEAMNVSCPIFWGYSNYSVGYLYNKEEAGKSFESASTNIPVGVPEKITEMCVKLVK